MRYTEMLRHLDHAWGDMPRRVRVIATRYYLGVDTIDDLQAMTEPQPGYRGRAVPPLLTREEADFIVMLR